MAKITINLDLDEVKLIVSGLRIGFVFTDPAAPVEESFVTLDAFKRDVQSFGIDNALAFVRRLDGECRRQLKL